MYNQYKGLTRALAAAGLINNSPTGHRDYPEWRRWKTSAPICQGNFQWQGGGKSHQVMAINTHMHTHAHALPLIQINLDFFNMNIQCLKYILRSAVVTMVHCALIYYSFNPPSDHQCNIQKNK